MFVGKNAIAVFTVLSGVATGSCAFGVSALAADPVVVKQVAPAVVADTWSIEVTPYFWMAGLKGPVRVGPRLPQVEVDQSFSDIFDDLDGAFTGLAVVRYGRFGFSTDLSYTGTTTAVPTPSPMFGRGHISEEVFFATVAGSYTVLENSNGSLDVMGGIRIWSWDSALELPLAGLGISLTASQDKSWVDPVIGLKGRVNLTDKFFLVGYGDIGGFAGGSDYTWQLLGTIGYQATENIAFSAGYRHLAVKYEDKGYERDVAFSGPILGATFKF